MVQTIPQKLKMLKGPLSMKGSVSSHLLIHPTSGSRRMIHPTVFASPGNTKEIQKRYSSPWVKGMRVRARMSAMATPRGKLTMKFMNQRAKVL